MKGEGTIYNLEVEGDQQEGRTNGEDTEGER